MGSSWMNERKITKGTIKTWQDQKLLNKAFKILKDPLPKSFEEEYFSRQAAKIDELAMSADLLQIAEALRNAWQMYCKNPSEKAWEGIYIKNMTHFRYLVSLIEDIDQDDAFIRTLSVLTGKDEKLLKKERSNLKN